MRRFPWRTLLLWTFPVVAFAWLALAGRAATGLPATMPQAGALLGGGAVTKRFVPLRNFSLHFTTVSVTDDGKHVKFYGDWNGRCDGLQGAVTATFFQLVALRSDGTFAGRGKLESMVADGSFTFEGRFTGAGRAVGTGDADFTFRRGSTSYECHTGTVSWQTRTSVNRFGKSHPRPGRAYYGNTSQRLPVVLRVAKNGRSIVQQAVLWNASCKKNIAGLGRGTSSPPIPIRKNGSFSFTERYTETYGDFIARVTSTHHGRFGLTTVAGTWRIRVEMRDASTNRRTDTCDSGLIRWSARI